MFLLVSWFFFCSRRRRHTRLQGDWSSDVCSSDLEINLIRQREWSRSDKNVKVRFQNDVKKRYLARARDVRPADFNNMNAVEQGCHIVRKGTEDMANDVRLTTDPLPLHEYRTIIQRAVLPGCATAACHGGGESGGRFQLYPRADHEAEAYANFLN